MPNITFSIEENLLKKGREYARKHRTSLNALIRKLLKDTVDSSDNWLEECFTQMDRAQGNSAGKKWTREEIHDR